MKKTNLSHCSSSASTDDVTSPQLQVAARPPHASAATTDLSGWTYERAEEPDITEFARWTDKGFPSTRVHFHNEAQITIVLSGARCFLMGGRPLIVRAGQFAFIPAGLPHRADSTGSSAGHGVNIYLRPKTPVSEPALGMLDTTWMTAGHMDFRLITEQILNRIGSPADDRRVQEATTSVLAELRSFDKLFDIAQQQGMTREAFSRAVTRQLGLPPHRYRMVERLNDGRQRLRTGESVATIASELEFADQSHFTRLFRSTFGTTPGRYRKAFT
jgi:AraC-like DNA-binding protein/mannose-6-phosphate isomerase-like protein (cupin superfamily)